MTTPVTYGCGMPKPTATWTRVCAAIGVTPSASAIPAAKSTGFMGHLRPAFPERVVPGAMASSQRQLQWGLRVLSASSAVTGECHPVGSQLSPGSRNASTRRWRDDLTHQPHHFSGLGVASRCLLGENAATVDLHLEHAARGLDQLHVGVRVGLADFGRQTGGSWLVVSDDAVFDRNAHAVNDSRACQVTPRGRTCSELAHACPLPP